MTWSRIDADIPPAQDVGRRLYAFCTLPDGLVAGDESARDGRFVRPFFVQKKSLRIGDPNQRSISLKPILRVCTNCTTTKAAPKGGHVDDDQSYIKNFNPRAVWHDPSCDGQMVLHLHLYYMIAFAVSIGLC